jgi:TetR/AcrR family transcriptional repressor of nem operon
MPRHAEYNRNFVITRATTVFWEQGYGKTSIGDLVEATGLQPGSLYGAFGNKKGLFLEVVDQYNQDFIGQLRSLRDADGPAIDKLQGILDTIVDDACTGNGRHGCLTVNALLELSRHDEEIAERLRRYNAQVRKAVAWLVRDAQAEGDVSTARDPNELASFVINNIWGMRVMCKSQPDRRSLEGVVAGVMAGLKTCAA